MSDLSQIQGLTLKKITTFLSPTFMKVIFSSMLLGVSTSILCLLIGYPLAYFMAIEGSK
jgi:ABC-type spermidine/putrescine transport system permease subunit I